MPATTKAIESQIPTKISQRMLPSVLTLPSFHGMSAAPRRSQ
jgi:hypothetical protein